MGGVFRLDDLLRQEDEQQPTYRLDDLLGKPPSRLGDIAAPLTRPMARDITALQAQDFPLPEIRPLPEPGGLKRFLTAAGTTARERGLMEQRPIQTPRRKRELMAKRVEVGNLIVEEGDLESDLATDLGEMLGSLVDPTIIIPFVGGERVAFNIIQAAAKRGLSAAQRFIALATAEKTAPVAQRALSSAVRAFGTAGTGAVAAETAQKVGREGQLPSPAEAATAFAVGTIAIPPVAAGVGALGGMLARLRFSKSRALLAPREIVEVADAARASAQRGGRLAPEEEIGYARRILGVGEDATDVEIGAAFRQRAGQFHPEGTAPDEELFKVLSEATATLRRGARPKPRPAPEPRGAAPEAETFNLDNLLGRRVAEPPARPIERVPEQPPQVPDIPPRTMEAFEEELARDLRAVEKPPPINRRPEVSAADRERLNLPGEQVRPQESTPAPETVSLKKAEGAEIRDRLGLEELQPAARQSFQEAWDEAEGRNLADQATDIAQEAAASRRPLTPTEHAGAVQRYLELERDLTEVRSTLADAIRQGNDQATKQLSARSQRILDEIDTLTEATDRTGSEAGRALSIRRLRANVETFTLASGLQMARGRKGGSLTPGEISQIERLTEQVSTLEEQNTRLRTENDELEQKRQQAIAEQVVRVEAKRPRKGAAARLQERQAILGQLAELGVRLNDISGVSAEGSYLIGKLAINLIREAVGRTGERVTLNRIVESVLAELNNPEIRPRDIHEALNARDPKRQARQQSEVTRQIRRLRSHARLLTQVEDAEAGIFAPSRTRPAQPAEIRALQKRLTELRNSAYRSGLHPTRLERAIATINELQDQLANHYRNIKQRKVVEVTPELAAMQAKIRGLRQEMRVEDTLADLEEQLRTGDFRIPERRVAPRVSPQLERKQIALQRARRRWRDAIERMAPLTPHRAIGETAGFLRTMKATADMSATLRQGFLLSARRPVTAIKAFAKAFKAFFSEYSADQIDNAIRQHPNQLLRDRAKLVLTERGGKLSSREEYFGSTVAERFPAIGAVVRASERSMTTTLNLLRVAAFDQFLELYPNATTDELRAWANWVNVATGRGDLGRMAGAANELAIVIFAPRFAVSRIQTPFMVFKHWQHPRARKEIAKDYAAVAGLGLTALGLAAFAGLSVGLDPRDPDFGKIRIGDTRIDIWGGVQQPMRVLARVMLGLTDRTGLTGRHLTKSEKEINPLELLGRFAAFKIAPLVSIPLELYRGKTAVGEETTPSETAVRSVLPMVFEDIYDAYRESMSKAILAGVSAFLGLGVATYEDRQRARGGPRAPTRPRPPTRR